MTTRIRVASALLIALMLASPLAPIANAQQPPAPPPPSQEMIDQTLRAQQAAEADRGIYNAGAVATNVFLIPGRAITCVLGGAVSFVLLATTFGTGYRAASATMHEGCGGKWMVTGDDLRPEGPTARPFDWEKRWD